MISAVSSFSGLTPNTKIIASSSDATPVQQVDRVTRKPVSNNGTNTGTANTNSSNQPADRLTLLGEKAVKSGKAYGMEASELRKQGMKNQLSPTAQSETPENSIEVMGEPGITEAEKLANAEAELANAQEAEKEGSQSADESTGPKELTSEEQQEVQKLKERDLEVKTHEQAHLAVAGGLAQGGASYEYQQGPDGKRYAVGGEVSIDTSPASTPQETIQKMQQVKAAALAPAEPSGQDRSVAASATQQMSKARQELTEVEVESEDTEESANAINKEDAEGESSNVSNTEGTEKPQTVEEMQEKSVEKAVSGENATNIVEAGMVEVPVEQPSENKAQQNNNPAPVSRLSIQQHAARVAYGISA